MLTSLGAYVTFMLTSPGPHVVMVWQDNELDLYAVPGHGSEQKEVTRTLTLAPNLTLALTHTHTLSLALNLALTLPLTLSQVRKVGVLKGHSSNVNHVDWDVTSRMLQSDCGAHELLNWMLYDDTPDGQGRWRPHQVPSPSSGPSPDPNPNPDPDPDPNLNPDLTAQEKTTSMMCDVQWATQSCVFGWALRGIWPEDADGTDVNACARSNTGKREIVVTADDFGKVELF